MFNQILHNRKYGVYLIIDNIGLTRIVAHLKKIVLEASLLQYPLGSYGYY